MSVIRSLVAVLFLSAALAGIWSPQGQHAVRAMSSGDVQDAIVVATSDELVAALSPANSGREILVRAGTYDVPHSLSLPDHASLIGEGVMRFDASGLPQGFDPAGRTVLKSAPDLVGDVLTLGNHTIIRGLVIEDALGRTGPSAGSVVAVSSRAALDSVFATILECEIVNPNPSRIALEGPVGRGLLVLSRNPNLGADPPPHDGAVLAVEMMHSIVRSPDGGSGVFAGHFASRSQITIALRSNVIGGGLDAFAGASRPDAVVGAAVAIESERNVYRSDSPEPSLTGWTLTGGADAPFQGLVSDGSNYNWLLLRSIDDDISGFVRGVSAIGGRRLGALSGSSSWNLLEVELHQTRLQTLMHDVLLFGAGTTVNGGANGDGNLLRVLFNHVTGSERASQYDHSSTPLMDRLGEGNRLEVVGNPNAFAQTNEGIDPAPSAEFFTSSH